MTEVLPAPRPRRKRSLAKVLRRLAVGVVVCIVLVELAFRAVLFLDVPGLKVVSARLRAPQNFFERWEPGYWTASVVLTPEERLRPVPGYDPLIGWRGFRVDAGTFAHKDEALVLTRRPVLLYGDSFAQCTTPAKECWQGLLAESSLRTTHCLVNYGVGGYGLDQIYLMLRSSIDRFADQSPVVIVGVMVDDDLDRSLLPFRGWPKPLFGLEHGSLVEPEPVIDGVHEYIDAHPPIVWSWAWRYLCHQRSIRRPPSAEAEEARRQEIRALSRALLREIQRELDARGVQWFCLLFQGESMLTKDGRERTWQYDFMVETLNELGVPYVSSRDAVANQRKLTGTDPALYFTSKGAGKGHYSALGNQAVFPAILRGIEGQFD